jgi:stearoyl-CoA desaturase (delta-9 desaturase)
MTNPSTTAAMPAPTPVAADPATPAPHPTRRRRRAHAYTRAPDERVNWRSSIPFILVHVIAVAGVLVFGVTVKALVLCVVLYLVRVWFITAGFHRYFSHRSYRTSRWFQFVLAFGGTTSAQKGVLWWAGRHREHHRASDTEADVHTPLRGFWWSHVGWILCDKYNETPVERIRDFHKYPELRFINKHDWLPPWLLGIACFLFAGLPGLFCGFLLSTVLLWHNTFFVNSLAHVMGRRRYATTDTSRNSIFIAITTIGEGWHNNHHYHQASARNGFFWWEWDPTYYGLKVLSWLRIVRDLKVPSEQVLHSNWIKDGAFDIGMFRANWAKAAAAVDDAEATVAPSGLRARRALAGEAITARREALEVTVHARKVALEEFVHDSLQSAEELARASRRRERELGVDHP